MRVAIIIALAVVLLAEGGVSAQPARPPGKGLSKGKANGSLQAQPQPALAGKGKTFRGKTLKEWIAELNSGDASKRTVAVLAIMQPDFVPESKAAVPAIVRLINDHDISLRAKACISLRYLEVDKDHVSNVVRALATRLWYKNERQTVIRYEAIVTLRRFANDAADAIPGLINCTLDLTSWETRHMAAGTLWRTALGGTSKGTDPTAVRALIKLLNGKITTYEEKLEVIIGLGSLKRSTDLSLQAEVIAQLDTASRTRSTTNRPLAIWAYAGLVMQSNGARADEALAAIGRHLNREKHSLEIRTQAVQALAALGPRAKSRIPHIIRMLDDPEPVAVDGACLALVRMGDSSDKITDALVSLLKHKDRLCVGSAITALANLKANKPSVLQGLEDLIKRENQKPAKDINADLIKLAQAAIKYIQKAEVKKPAQVIQPLNPRKAR
jgi:hypothetical protein